MKFTTQQQELVDHIFKRAKYYRAHQGCSNCDLHIHSTQSDGKFSVKQLIYIAAHIGLEYIYITDHNTILPTYEALEEALKLPKQYPVTVRIGSEIACKIESISGKGMIPIEILAYHVDPYLMQSFLDQYSFSAKESQEENLEQLKAICDTVGLLYTKDLQLRGNMYATEILCEDLIQFEENKEYFKEKAPIVLTEPKLFYKKLVANPDSDFYIDTIQNTIPYYIDTIDAIHQAGGYASLSHPYLFQYETKEDVTRLLQHIFSNSTIDAIETWHSAHTPEQIEHLKQMANTAKKYSSGGSDFHRGPKTIMGYGKDSHPIFLTTQNFKWLLH